MKKIAITAIIFFILALGIGTYIIFYRPVEQAKPVDDSGASSSPFGNLGADAPISTSTAVTSPTAGIQLDALTHLYMDPIAGAAILTSKSGSTTGVRFTERATGHINDISLLSGQYSRVSNTTIPKIYQSLWLSGGSTTILRFLNDTNNTIRSYAAKMVPVKSASSSVVADVQGSFLLENIVNIAPNPAGNKLFYIVANSAGAQGEVANIDGSKRTAIFSSAITEWVVSWPGDNTIALTTKPSTQINGYLYFLTPAGTIKKVLGGIRGLVTLVNPQATLVGTSDGNASLSIRDIKTGKTQSTSLRTIADKCVWSIKQKNIIYCAIPTSLPAGQYPDSWYQGLVSFSDEIYSINTTTGTSTVVGALKTKYNQDIDATDLHISPKNDYLVFTNKKDLSLWSLMLPLSQGTTTAAR